jgi:hypothetical protein
MEATAHPHRDTVKLGNFHHCLKTFHSKTSTVGTEFACWFRPPITTIAIGVGTAVGWGVEQITDVLLPVSGVVDMSLLWQLMTFGRV